MARANKQEDDIRLAYLRWSEVYGLDMVSGDNWIRWKQFLGMPTKTLWRDPLTEEARSKINQINGPHYRAILKAMAIRRKDAQ